MDPISTFNRVAALVQQQLQKRDKTGRTSEFPTSGASSPTEAKTERAPADLQEALQQLLSTLRAEGASNGTHIGRAAIQLILEREFSGTLANEPEFQQMVDTVHQALIDDPAACAILQRLSG